MQYVNDDMDDLFRRAAKHYPLDTNSSDWNKVAAALVNSEGTPAPEEKKRSFLWLIMLIPLSMICHLYLSPGNIQIKNGGQGIPASINPAALSAEGILKKPASPSFDDITLVTGTSTLQNGEIHTRLFTIPRLSNKKTVDKQPDNKNYFTDVSQSDISDPTPSKIQTSLPLTDKKKWSLQPLNPIASTIVTTAPVPQPYRLKQKRFYAGIMGGIDASTVKFQKVEDAGYAVGILAGYELNKKWSVEGGFFLDKKFYYTKAEYFDKSKISYMPANTWITEVEGSCSMFEIPLAIKFNIVRNKKSSWFTTAGVSSYIMKNEDYSYVYYYSMPPPGVYATHDKTYKNSSVDMFSVITFSGGYTHRIGKSTDIRLEPYLKLPVNGMGFGNLPLISGGLHAGITRKLF